MSLVTLKATWQHWRSNQTQQKVRNYMYIRAYDNVCVLGLGSSNRVGESETILELDVSDSQLIEKLSTAMSNGDTVTVLIRSVAIVQDTTEAMIFVSKVFKRAYFKKDSQTYLDSSCSVLVHDRFKLFIVIKQSLEDVIQSSTYSLASLCGNDWSSVFLVELGLSLKGLQSYLQKLILKYKKPEYSIRYKSLLTDLTLHCQRLENNEVSYMYMCN